MAKHEIDFDDYEERTGYNGEDPKPGLYSAKLVVFEEHTAASSGQEGFHWVFELTDEPYAGWRGHLYSNAESTKWRTQEIVRAIRGGSTDPVTLDTDKADALLKRAKPVKVRVKLGDEYQGQRRPRITSVIVSSGSSTRQPPAATAKSDPWDEEDD